MVIDVKSSGAYPANVLSNFYPNAFVLDGVKCASMEGFLQSLKSRSVAEQIHICTLSGIEAKNYFKGKFANFRWKLTGKLFWQGKKIKRRSCEYDTLLKRAYGELAKNEEFAKALDASLGKTLIHSVGKHKKGSTVLTEEEFIDLLCDIRAQRT